MKQGHYHFSVKNFSRGSSAPAPAKAAYRSGENITFEKTGQPFNYSPRKETVVTTNILAPANQAPEWAFNRSEMWNEVEADPRKNLRFAKEIEAALPRSLDWETNIAMVYEFVQKNVDRFGFLADVCFHSKDTADGLDNPHVHIMMTTCTITPEGFGEKILALNERSLLNQWRKEWADHVNGYLERAGIDERIDHRSLKDQGVDRLPQIHMGPTARAMEDNGKISDRGNRLRRIHVENMIRDFDTAMDLEDVLDDVEETTLRTALQQQASETKQREGPTHGRRTS